MRFLGDNQLCKIELIKVKKTECRKTYIWD